ncbi:phenylacetaldoxime dehydratase [Colletotrichum tofieldiae]|uniref:Phenylacetaldoxime dehydratase n=1 Tax=Colletotrichum tofieldiae TaxID=708197 RepID=A0A166Y7L5_9PEZI|nr:phenylacetaldoxime dehydratase [Colletotrichum tofieldiae]GKT58388.1 phenylacetaldoxime dehydratase [Colletotrichum tofieldiae]GKT79896.1 phenylacetaldoxime dehydratase [Colletotrichum tofieldiae]GKT84471.1 phenylacetaldoxime dehydratase [Colletotrichum tofieldiae]
MPPNFKPAFDLYTSRFPKEIKDVVMAVIGAQYPSAETNDGKALKTISSFLAPGAVDPDSCPAFHEVAAVVDNRGFYNIAVLAYWPSTLAYENWSTKSGFRKWWAEAKPGENPRHGWFLEVFLPTVDRLETVFTTAVPEGASHMRERVSGPIREHVYWGSMRDRLPVSQTDELLGEATKSDTMGLPNGDSDLLQRIRIPGRKNLVVIRSGQDWSAALQEERLLYVNSMQPPLVKGMDYLRDYGGEVGCLSCRFMEIVDPITVEGGKDRTFALAYFDDLASLEQWSKEHRTHLAIFGEFAKYAKSLGDKMSLSLFHEVLVLEPEQQVFEYIGCHRGTGMLGSL